MSTTTLARTAPRGDSEFTGTGTLIRFALRRDRIRIPVWIAALTAATAGTASSFTDLYPTAADRAGISQTINSPAGLAMTGPAGYLRDYSLGSMMGHQMLGFTAIMVGLMSVLLVVRHSRAEEESGRAELVRAAVVGRHAQLTAALIVTAAANALLGLLTTISLGSAGADGVGWGGAVLYGAALAATGLVFAGIAAVAVQFTEHSRGASGMAMAAVALAYLLRASGDVGDNGLSWVSPIGWAQRTYVFVDNNWWPLLLAVALAGVLVAVAFRLSTRRDVGTGLRQARPGAAAASDALTNPVGLALRLHRGMLIGFGVAMALMGMAYGSILGDAEDMLSNIDAVSDALAEIGGASIAESFAAMIMVVLAILAAVYVVMAALKPRTEELAGRAEPVLATPLSRARWLGSHLAVVLGGGSLVLLLGGLAFGIAGAASVGDAGLIGTLTGAAAAFLPSLWLTGAMAVLLFGLVPRAAALAWAVPVYAFIVGYLGQILQFPDWLTNLSPFGVVPRLPVEEFDATPLIVLTVLAAVLVAAGLRAFRARSVNVS